MYRVRYCEMILPYPEGGGVTASVYGTQQLNDCPQEAWEAIDPEAVAEEYGSLAALQNGPRYWVLDDIEIGEGGFTGDPLPGRGEIFFFGQLEMRLLTSVFLPVDGNNQSGVPYTSARVDRNTIFHFVAGRRVYELQDPQGNRYIMQSYSQIVDSDLQFYELTGLGERLELPEGWQFSTYILEEPLELLTDDGVAEVVQDELSNTYQRIP